MRELVREVLKDLSHTFGKLYSHEGRLSITPEQLLSALLLQVFYSIRSERQLMEQLDYNLLFRWLVGLSPDDPIWDATVFTKNRERLQEGDVFQKFMAKLLEHDPGNSAGIADDGHHNCRVHSFGGYDHALHNSFALGRNYSVERYGSTRANTVSKPQDASAQRCGGENSGCFGRTQFSSGALLRFDCSAG